MARDNMAWFNNAVNQENATGFVQSVTRDKERRAHCGPPAPRTPDGLLTDNKEELSSPPSLSRRGRKRKKKPLARNVSGIEHQILMLVKVHLYTYALHEGIYQTRATFLLWAAAVYYATWQMELPTTPYVNPPQEYLEILVNSIATSRGQAKELMHPMTENIHGFVHCLRDQQAIQENLNCFNLIYPNSFHCKSYCPRQGHYESPDVPHAIAGILFRGPSLPGVLFPDYFKDMSLNIVAFVLAIWQFTIKEWANRWQQNGDLGTGLMRDKFKAILAALKDFRNTALKRLERLCYGY
ncbi:hypothetical protein FRC07_001347 [Ceratobasidium sp. 392]|nr:hypothetical protein FRC07_001347 [Ceratobasidium sp. 392]